MAETATQATAAGTVERGLRAQILCINVGHFQAHFFMLIYPTVVLSLEADGLGAYGDLLLPSTLGFVAFGLGTLPAGWLGDRWSRRAMLALMFFGMGAGSLVTGLATGPWQVGLGLGLIGLFAAIYHPVGIALLVERARPLGRSLGINGVFGNMGVAAAPILAAAFAESLGWRWAFFLPGAAAIATGFVFVALRWDEGRHEAQARKQERPVDRAALSRVFAFLLASAFLGGMVFHITTISLPKMIDQQFHVWLDGVVGAGALASAIFALAAFAQIAVGWLIDRYPLKPLAVALPFLQAPLLFLAVILAGAPAMAATFAMMLIVFGEIPITDTLVARHSKAAWRARFYAAKYVLALGVGALAVPAIAWLHDPAAGFTQLYGMLAVMSLCLGAAATILPREAR